VKPISDQTPVIVGAGQFIQRLPRESAPGKLQSGDLQASSLKSPMQLAACAASSALTDAGIGPELIDTITVIRLFSDAAPAWHHPSAAATIRPSLWRAC